MFRKFKPFEASRVFEFKDPDTGFQYREKSLADLYKRIVTYRAQNNLEPLELLREVVENYLCGLPENTNKCQPMELQRSWFQTVVGGVLLLKNLAFRRYAPQKVAEERAKQCEGCKFNVFPDKGPFISFADNIAVMQVGERRTENAEKLGNCEVCTCVLKSKVFYQGSLPKFPEDQLVQLRSVNCWQLKLSGQK